METGGAKEDMRDLEQSLEELSTGYSELIEGYRSLWEASMKEKSLAEPGKMECLLSLLREKEERLRALEQKGQELQGVQEWLSLVLEIGSFTLVALEEKLPVRLKGKVAELTGAVKELTRILSGLEQEEKNQAERLDALSHTLKSTPVALRGMAQRAYKKP